MSWITKSNRPYHALIGIISALFGTIIGALEVAIALEGKDCQADALNKGLPPWKWSFRKWDWLDWLATMIGGMVGQAIQIGVVFIVISQH